jgi:hypothetical protein
MDAKCIRKCYDCSTHILYQAGETYPLPVNRAMWKHFEVPGPKIDEPDERKRPGRKPAEPKE